MIVQIDLITTLYVHCMYTMATWKNMKEKLKEVRKFKKNGKETSVKVILEVLYRFTIYPLFWCVLEGPLYVWAQ